MKSCNHNCENSDSFLVIFKKARKKFHNYIAARIKEYELTANQIDILLFLSNNKNYNTAKDIVEFIGVSKGLVSRSIDDLIARDILYVREDEKDRRKLRLFMTDKGKEMVQKIDKLDKEFLLILVDGVTKEEMKAHLSLCKKLADNLKSME